MDTDERRITVSPRSMLGKWSLGLAAAFVLLFALHQIIAASVRRNPVPDPGAPSPAILVVVVADFVSGIAAFVAGLISVLKSRERSVLVFIVVAIGFLVSIFLIGELAFEP